MGIAWYQLQADEAEKRSIYRAVVDVVIVEQGRMQLVKV